MSEDWVKNTVHFKRISAACIPLSLCVISSLSLVVSLLLCVVLSSAFSYFVSLALPLFLFVCRSFFTMFLCRTRCLYSCIIFLSLSLSLLPYPHFLALPSLSSITLLSLFIFLSLHYHCQSVSLSLYLFRSASSVCRSCFHLFSV